MLPYYEISPRHAIADIRFIAMTNDDYCLFPRSHLLLRYVTLL